MTSDTRMRVAERTGEWATGAREASRRGDRAAVVAACAHQARAELGRPGSRGAAPHANRVRELLCDLIPCPVGRWGTRARGALLERLPRLTDHELRVVAAVATA